MFRFATCILFVPLLTAAVATAQETTETSERDSISDKGDTSRDVRQSVCLLVESAAHANGLPVEFFVRLIWQESRFKPAAIGPLTRSGKRALGIAQFMPGTAAERNLLDPFNPIEALPKAAELLKDLRSQFGNLGLAAAAYNAGPGRVRAWMAGATSMPSQTRVRGGGHWPFGRHVGQRSEATANDFPRSGPDFPRSAPTARCDGRDSTLGRYSWCAQIAHGNFGAIRRARATVLFSAGRTGSYIA
jgi:hypothetical protein